MDILTCGIVDDDPETIRLLKKYLSKMQHVRILFQTTAPTEALDKLRKYHPDILFLDVEMPELSAFDLIKWIKPPTKVVLCTGHREYAYDGFEHRVADFLLKPIDFSRFFDVVTRLREPQFHAILNSMRVTPRYCIVNEKNNRKNYKVLFEDILYIEAIDGGAQLVLAEEEKIVLSEPLVRVYNALPKNLFVRISNSFVINTEYYKSYADSKVFLYHVKRHLPISRIGLAKDFSDWLNEHKL
ncbi:LytTR family DNA-binding domain-containing protein [Olivibacter sp. XZL3]|uniref:LytR/AlgR family response regulator transcription factor n=1 Tax=Olivibacter sp. XZL3 TaxID=1735116 RepID=UPI00106513DB|nr:LytTR family DNA-binding domain-containing protein [Olivibacter sp. XZL3]